MGERSGVADGSRWIGRAAVLLLLAALLGIGLISAGVFDPQPPGDFVTGLPVETLSVAAGNSRLQWLDTPLPAGRYSFHLTAALQSGEQDIGYGLALGDERRYLVAAVSPLGYVTIANHESANSNLLRVAYFVPSLNRQYGTGNTPLPWQPWPHVRPETNEIWLDVAGDQLTVRVNREWLWQGTVETSGRVGLWLESYGQAAAVHFQELNLFTPTPN
jgi:hypothetical protein